MVQVKQVQVKPETGLGESGKAERGLEQGQDIGSSAPNTTPFHPTFCSVSLFFLFLPFPCYAKELTQLSITWTFVTQRDSILGDPVGLCHICLTLRDTPVF